MDRWKPPVELSKKEQLIMKRLNRVRALFGFLRTKRHILFDDAFQEQLEGVYRQTGAGDTPHAPAMLCMVVLLQGYVGASDAEAVEMAVMDRRWQLVLDCLDVEEPPFSQGALQAFRERMVENGIDRVLLERTVALVRDGAVTKVEGQHLSKAVRVAIDSRPLAGAGRVEDTINLLGHAARKIAKISAKLTDRSPEEICRKAGIPLLLSPSIKAGLDIDWSDPRQKATAIQIVEHQVASLERWVEKHLDDVVERPLKPYLEAIMTVRDQDLEQTENDGVRIRQGVAVDRRISIQDAEMRHGRKSRSKRFDRFKEHIAYDLDGHVILACSVTPANRPEEEGAAPIGEDIDRQGFTLSEVHIDRAYVNSPLVATVQNDSSPGRHRSHARRHGEQAHACSQLHWLRCRTPARARGSEHDGVGLLDDPVVEHRAHRSRSGRDGVHTSARSPSSRLTDRRERDLPLAAPPHARCAASASADRMRGPVPRRCATRPRARPGSRERSRSRLGRYRLRL